MAIRPLVRPIPCLQRQLSNQSLCPSLSIDKPKSNLLVKPISPGKMQILDFSNNPFDSRNFKQCKLTIIHIEILITFHINDHMLWQNLI